MKVTVKPVLPPSPERAFYIATGAACPKWPREESAGPFEQLVGKKICGYLITKRGAHGGWQVGSISVREGARRQRVGTALYAKAAELSCVLTGAPLSSDTDGNRSDLAEGFWKKQLEKGRARIEGGAYVLSCPAPALDGVRPARRRHRWCSPRVG